jgi:hypothetical protein
MNKIKFITAISILSSVIVSCSSPPTSDDINNTKGISEQYKSFGKLSEKLVKSQQHGGIFVNTFIDNKGMDAFKNKSYPFPDGSVVVKEGHDTETSGVSKLYVMKKIKSFDSANGDWYYSILDTKGNPMQAGGKIQMCISCHQGAKDKDYVFGF